ncbi:MAG: response regulator, partial [Gammaproteobacteria bacterium]|nr:response regulator [Gammaproteobacteria bacterium]
DMVLMDCQMPVMDGYEATAAIRKKERDKSPDRHTPIIALTANALEGDRERCLAADMDDYLSKPFKQKQLRLSLERWLLDKPQVESQPAAGNQPEVGKYNTELSQINEKALDALRALQRPGRPDILQKVVGLYLDNSPTLLQNLQNAISENIAAEVQIAAHSLKSSSANLGATELAALCKTLESMGRNHSLEGAAEKLAEIQERYEQVSHELMYNLQKTA